MSNATNNNDNNNDKDVSDIKKAAEHADSEQIEKNLNNNMVTEDKQVKTPEALSEDEKTPFIDDDLRTDK
ncbi:hypothetical protein J3492_01080 [Psychrobacter sp. F1192]|uniref:Uncharacterized protein n=1 Tax=Psychrobacter coccoides TaxID=2818440 RepID=A0ABS3NKF0_9GAMM|nr:hypothetical protein [Psychrobacter coccoides]MBO1529808.1 hypothetical protein [Psychrobacter coccoides]